MCTERQCQGMQERECQCSEVGANVHLFLEMFSGSCVTEVGCVKIISLLKKWH